MRIRVHEAEAVVQKGELSARVVCHGGFLDDGLGMGEGRDGACESFARHVEHVDGYVEAGEGGDAAAVRGPGPGHGPGHGLGIRLV